MSIRLICSDIDGTLLQYGKKELEDEIFEQMREAASARHSVLPGIRSAVYQPAQALCTSGGLLCVSLRKRRRDL